MASEADPSTDTFGQVGYTTMIILLFFLFTVFGILTVFLVRHKPRRRVPVGRSAKLDIENQLDSESSRDRLNLDDPNELAAAGRLDTYPDKQPFIFFSDPKNPYESYEGMPIREEKQPESLKQPSSENLSNEPPGPLNAEDQKNPPTDAADDNKSLEDHAVVEPQSEEKPEEKIEANVEPVKDENDTQTEPFTNADEAKVIEPEKEHDEMQNELKPAEERPVGRTIEDLPDTGDKVEEKPNESPAKEVTEPKKDNTPEYATFPDGSDPVKSDRESIKSLRSTKSYHSYGFPDEDYPANATQPEFKPDKKSNPAIQRQKLEKPSDYNELMKNLTGPSARRVEDKDESPEEPEKKESDTVDKDLDKDLGKNKDLEAKEGHSESRDSSPLYDYRLIVCPPLDKNDPNAKYVVAKDEAKEETSPSSSESAASTSAGELFSSPEDPNGLGGSSQREFENSNLQSENPASSAPANERSQQVQEAPQDKPTETTPKPADKIDESGSLKTLNSENGSLTTGNPQPDPKIGAKTGSRQTEDATNSPPLTTRTQPNPTTPTASQPGEQNGRTPKSVLDVLEKRKGMQ